MWTEQEKRIISSRSILVEDPIAWIQRLVSVEVLLPDISWQTRLQSAEQEI